MAYSMPLVPNAEGSENPSPDGPDAGVSVENAGDQINDHADIADANTFEMLLHHDAPSMVYPETDNSSRDLSSEQHPECSAPFVIQTVL
ncbi:hypothetical protein V8E53_004169, partial [Lactarius tabidus]